jgi:hypothetical protein
VTGKRLVFFLGNRLKEEAKKLRIRGHRWEEISILVTI